MHRYAAFGSVAAVVVSAACVEPPPKIRAIPPSGLALRLFIFGASAQETYEAFNAAKRTNEKFSLVKEGGDGEVLIGLDNDSPICVPPTGLCSYKLAVRVRDNGGAVVHRAMLSASASGERCTDLCSKAVNSVVVQVVEAAALSLKSGAGALDGGEPSPSDAGAETDASEAPPAPPTAAAAAKPPVKKAASKGAGAKPPEPPPKPEPAICSIAHGPHLPTDDAEKRAAQVEVLKRINVLDQDEYDCLRKAYLDRL
jgi:hypothetical protein